ncbi:MAG TPA: preprotein translocase subunit SecA [Caldisericia bacterium]|nr:preprotein translocase subunit SecA [Caldisericia bacterium]HPB33540.1 preprotein translocase subunit SecA [Caldisericia bacterium]HQL66503.1 preprotein translocase subunit SecA [Caldisericia bacterium]HQN48071.1 preprotein translocase subunit SecA [Caldisericia bacterium]HQO99192.1 preprotein translocase subunit SecA [Caldisericia bacterium]
MAKIFKKIFSNEEKDLKKLQNYVIKINSFEQDFEKYSNDELTNKTPEFLSRLENGETLEDILCEAFAVVREVSKRIIKLRHFDVQLMGGVILHEGKIAEMKTGEGKTLVATLPIYLNSLTKKGVHLITVNDYLAKRDALWMGPIYRFLNRSVGVIQHESSFLVDWDDSEKFSVKLIPCSRKEAYLADITYGTNNEFGFDYLRDNMAINLDGVVQRELNYAIVDEVDSILIDEARTPLIISGPSEKSTSIYYKAAQVARQLKIDEDFTSDEKEKNVALTESGVKKVEKLMNVENLYASENVDLVSHIIQALRALIHFKKDVDYIVKEGEVIIVDEFTGRLMFGRRYSDGLHQAIEAKENLTVKAESQTLATITFQNYFRMYSKLAGMTGTAKTEEDEFIEIYGLPVIVIPTNKPMIRKDHPDVVYRTEKIKFRKIIEGIKDCYKIGQPVLVGTRSIEKNELLSSMLKREGISHQILNAKYHEKEAEIIKHAGEKGMVTIATNMAGRGVDIVLGSGVVELGGLHIIGTERHEARRIDNQLRGRSGRQGDPGSSRFYLSLEDEILRIFGGDTIKKLMEFFRMDDDTPLEHPLLSRTIENAQKKVEAYHFEIRKNLLEYDNVLNKHREIIYKERRRILEKANLREDVFSFLNEIIDEICDIYLSKSLEEPDYDGLSKSFLELTGILINKDELAKIKESEIKKILFEISKKRYEEKESYLRELAKNNEDLRVSLSEEPIREIERYLLLRILDNKWKDHLYNMDHLKEGIGLRAYGQQEPLIAYQLEGYELFQSMLKSIREDWIKFLFRVEIKSERKENREERRRREFKKNKR